RLARADRGGPSSEDEKGGLEGVLRVGLVVQYAAADRQHHRAMTLEQLREGILIAVGDESPQQGNILLRRALPGRDETADVCENPGQRVISHASVLPRPRFFLLIRQGSGPGRIHFFSCSAR